MKAIVIEEFGPPEVLRLKEVDKPVPQENEILVRVHASTVNYGDLIARNFRNIPSREFNMPLLLWLPARIVFGLKKPTKKILGNEFAGEVETVGKNVTRFKKGDRVFGYRAENFGAYAEYLCMPESGIVATMPSNLSYDEAAPVPYGAIMALNLLRKTDIRPGRKVLVNGASGGIGSAAVQIAKSDGADVTGVCGTARMDFVQSLGADKVIDYTKQDFTKNGETYDLIVDILGRSSFSRCKGSLNPNGVYLLVSFKMKALAQMFWTSFIGNKKVRCALASGTSEDLAFIRTLIETGKFRSIVDRRFPLGETAEAHRYVEEGHRRGPVVIAVSDGL